MAAPIYLQTIIAMIWDFDRTLIPGYSQQPLFDAYGVDANKFWSEVNNLQRIYSQRDLRVAEDTAYLLHMLTYVREGIFDGLTNTKLRELGAELEFCPGMPDFMVDIANEIHEDERYSRHYITLEHYIVSTGVRPLIEGSAVGPYVRAVWANEFLDQPPPPSYLIDEYQFAEAEGPIEQVGYMIDNTSKTRAIFEINKGPEFSVNARVAEEDRRVPIRNMIYVADGPSDVPVFSILGRYGGRSLGVYQTGASGNYKGVKQLQDDGRVNSIAPADYRNGQPADLWLRTTVHEIAARICDERERHLSTVKGPAGHVS